MSVTRKTGYWEHSEPGEYVYYEYILNIDNLLSTTPNDWYTWQSKSGDKTTAVSYGIGFLEQGKRYLIFLDPSEGGPFIKPERAAKINNNGTIIAIPSITEYMPDENEYTGFSSIAKYIPNDNVFYEFNGYTAGQLKEEAERAKTWHENYVK